MKYTYNQKYMSNQIFEFTYMCAMRDAVLQEAFKGPKTWVEDVAPAKVIVRQYIDKVLNNEFNSQDSHDCYFIQSANEVCRAINMAKPHIDVSTFCFGNAQKLINMTVKYTYSFCYPNPSLRYGFRYCHCPLDSIMCGKVWRLCENHYGGSKKRREKLGVFDDFNKAWGNEGSENGIQLDLTEFPKRYALFQKAVKDIIGQGDIFPVEFDYMEWK